jgi:hypothetical protein
MDNMNIENKDMQDRSYAFLNKDGIVLVVYLYDPNDSNLSLLLEQTKNDLNADDVKSCKDHGFASIGWHLHNNTFYPPQPYPSWIRNEELETWDSPVPYPINDINDEIVEFYTWNEETLNWVLP